MIKLYIGKFNNDTLIMFAFCWSCVSFYIKKIMEGHVLCYILKIEQTQIFVSSLKLIHLSLFIILYIITFIKMSLSGIKSIYLKSSWKARIVDICL